MAMIFAGSMAIANDNNDEEVTMVPLDNGIKILMDGSIYVTDNDSVLCISKVNGGLISAFENKFVFKGKSISQNHPNYGFFQESAERYFNSVMLKYIRTPKGKIVSDKQSDINEMGVPKDRIVNKNQSGDIEVTLVWQNVKIIYNEYGKRLYRQDITR